MQTTLSEVESSSVSLKGSGPNIGMANLYKGIVPLLLLYLALFASFINIILLGCINLIKFNLYLNVLTQK